MKERRSRHALLAAALAGLVLLPGTVLTGTGSADAVIAPSPAVVVAKMTGADAVTDTTGQWAIEGTDLGIMWDNGAGELLTAFGDTFGGWGGDGGGGDDWRSNVLARSGDADLADGIAFDSAPEDTPGHAKELVPSKKVSGDEMTTIPTAAISVGTRQYLAYMSIRQWGAPGEWWTNYSRIAYSDDNGENWNSTDGPTWENTADSEHPFQMVAFAQHGEWVYMFGTPNGRSGQIHVARVAPAGLLDKDAYTYWTGAAWEPGDGTGAVPIMSGHASEMGVIYNEFAHKWVALYLQDYDGIVMRTADEPTGPWSEAVVVADPDDYPQLYGGFIHPASSEGQDLYFAMSEWRTYSVYLMKLTLRPDGTIGHPNLIADPNFEHSTAISAPWVATGIAGIDTTQLQFSGGRNAWMRHNSGWIDVHQNVAVTPNTDYLLTAWVRTGGASDEGSLGVRTIDGDTPIAEQSFTDLGSYTRQQVSFNSGSHDAVQVYAGSLTDNGDRWVQADTFSLVETGEVPPVQDWAMGLATEPEAGTTLAAGDLVTYTVTLTNQDVAPGIVIDDVFVTDDLSSVIDDAEIVEGSASASSGTVDYADGRLRWAGPLAPGADVVITYSVRVGDDGARGDSSMTNALSARSPGGRLAPCAVEGCRSAAFQVVDAPPKPFAVTVDSDPVSGSSVASDDIVTFTITATNLDASRDLTDVVVTAPGGDLFDDAYLDVVSMAPSSGETVLRGRDLEWATPLAAGAAQTLTLSARVKPATALGDGVLRLTVSGTAMQGEIQPCTSAGCDVAMLSVGSGAGSGDTGGTGDRGAGTAGAEPNGAGGGGALAWTGATVGWALAAAALLVAAGAGAVLVARHRRSLEG